MNGAECANSIIKNGIFICHKIWPEKCKHKPTQCLKYQGWGHLAVDYKTTDDICGTCSENHCPADCNNKLGSHYCITCNSQDHVSWDRNCPEFIRRCKEMDQRYSENAMPFFVTKEPWTQVSLLLKPPKTTQCPLDRDKNKLCQTTLQYAPSNTQRQEKQHVPPIPRTQGNNSRETNHTARTSITNGARPNWGDEPIHLLNTLYT